MRIKFCKRCFVAGIIALIIIGVLLFIILAQKTGKENGITPIPQTGSQIISEIEKEEIERWLQKNNLNQYGDPQNTVYTGGTPLFDEVTGAHIDRFKYIIKNNPGQPWKKTP